MSKRVVWRIVDHHGNKIGAYTGTSEEAEAVSVEENGGVQDLDVGSTNGTEEGQRDES